MPRVQQNPDDYLLNKIKWLESQVRDLSTLRQRPSPSCRMTTTNNSQGFDTGTSLVHLNSVDFSTAGMADTSNYRITIPSDGIYLVSYFKPDLSHASLNFIATTSVYLNGSAAIAGSTVSSTWFFGNPGLLEAPVTLVESFEKDDYLDLRLNVNQNTVTQSGYQSALFRLAVQRLSDIPVED